nr:hypothetical protein [Micromonospora sp. DSM 115978]
PESSHGYRDMRDFTESLTDRSLQDRLRRALDGRGAFRRFRDVLHDSDDAFLQQWLVFEQERALGRARRFLAIEGCRALP